MSSIITRESLVRYAATFEEDEFRDGIILQLGRRQYNSALDACSRAIFELIKRQRASTCPEEKEIWLERCRRYEYLEKMLLRKAVIAEQGAARTPAPGAILSPSKLRPSTRADLKSRYATHHSHHSHF